MNGKTSLAAVGLTVANILVAGINAVVGILIARLLTSAEYGEFSYLMGLYLLATLLTGLGLTSQIIRDIAGFRAQQRGAEVNSAFYTLLALRIISVMGLMGGLAIYSSVTEQPLPAIIGLAAALSIVADFLTGALRGLERLGGLIVVLCIQPITYLGLILAYEQLTIERIMLVFCLSQGITLLVASGLLIGAGIGLPRRGALSQVYVRRSGGGAFRLYLVSLLSVAFTVLGNTLLGAFAIYQPTGLLSVSLTIAQMLPLILGITVVSIFYPQLCACLDGSNPERAAALFAGFYRISALLGIGSVVVLALYPGPAIQLLYTSTYRDAAPALIVLAPMSLLLILDGLFSWTLVAHGLDRQVIAILLVRIALLLAGLLGAVAGGQQMVLIIASLGYLIAACVGVLLYIPILRSLKLYRFDLAHLGAATLLALGLGALSRLGLPDLQLDLPYLREISYAGNMLGLTLGYTASVLIIWYHHAIAAAISRISVVSLALFHIDP